MNEHFERITETESKNIMLEILQNIDSFCRNNDIKYFLAYGTLIGAVRHKGYIPWDDDIDIQMLRQDYNKFISMYSDSRYILITPENENNYYLPFAKVYDNQTLLVENISHSKEIGVYIDIFPIDDCGSTHEESVNFSKKSNLFRKMLAVKNLQFSSSRAIYKNCILVIAKMLLLFIPRRAIIDRLQKKISCNLTKDISFVGELSQYVYDKRSIWRKEVFRSVIYVEFEGYSFCVPVGYDEYLKTTYGDYMQMPPEEKRISHHSFDAWWKSED